MDIIQERPILKGLYSNDIALPKPEFQWFLARSCDRRGTVQDLPGSIEDVRTTKELLEGDWFDKAPGGKGWNICLIIQKLLSYERSYESSQSETPIKKEPRIKKEPQIKKEPRIKKEPQTKKEQVDSPSYSDTQSLFVRSRDEESQAQHLQISSRKRSRTELSLDSDDLPEDPFRFRTEERLSSFPALSDRTRTISPLGNSFSTIISIPTSKADFPIAPTAPTAPTAPAAPVAPTAPAAPAASTASTALADPAAPSTIVQDDPPVLSGRTRGQNKRLEKILQGQKGSKGKKK